MLVCPSCGESFPVSHKGPVPKTCRNCWRRRPRVYDPERAREYREKHRDNIHEYAKTYYTNNKEHFQEYRRKYRETNGKKIKERERAYYQAHRKELRAKDRNANRRIRVLALERVAKRWGDTQPRCRFDTLPDGHPLKNHPCYGELQIDHMNGGGNREVKFFKFHAPINRMVADGRRAVHDLRILCRLHQLWNMPANRGEPEHHAE